MSIQIAVAGNGIPQQDIPQNRIPIFAHPAGAKMVLPENRDKRRMEMLSAAAEIEKVTLAFNKKLKFVVDHQSHEISVKVIDPATDKVIKVLPPEELQRLHRRLKETIGVLFDERI
jgi:flagellar protein FlaG